MTDYEPSPEKWVRDQVEKYEGSGGTEGTTLKGKPVVVLTTVGAKTGKIRKSPLMRVEHDGDYAIVASDGGGPKHPTWFHNIKAKPEVELQDLTVKKTYVAREVTGEEYELWWDRAATVWPDYNEYQKKTNRKIPVFVLEPKS